MAECPECGHTFDARQRRDEARREHRLRERRCARESCRELFETPYSRRIYCSRACQLATYADTRRRTTPEGDRP